MISERGVENVHLFGVKILVAQVELASGAVLVVRG